MNWKYILIVVILAVIVGGSVFWIAKMSQKKLGEEPTTASLLSEFVETVSRAYKPATKSDGILPEPPRAQIKKAEGFLKDRVKSTVKVAYAFTDYAPEPPLTHSLVVYAAPDPFRWRVDFIMNLKDGQYKNIYLYDGSDYYSCSNTSGNTQIECYQEAKTFLENDISTPFSLTEFLNDFLEPLSLKKLVPGTKESGQAKFQKYTQTIAGYLVDCQVADDEYSTLDFCLTKDTNLLLYLDLKRKSMSEAIFGHFTLTAQSVDFSPFPQEVFTTP